MNKQKSDTKFENKYLKVKKSRDHFHCIGQYRDVVNNICNLKKLCVFFILDLTMTIILS